MTTPPTTSEGKHAWLRDGKELVFNLGSHTPNGKETAREKAARSIQAAWIAELVRDPGRKVSTRITISNAIIEGPLNLGEATFKDRISITNSEFTGPVDFSFCTFEHSLILSSCQFRDALDCDSVVARYRVVFDAAQFFRGTLKLVDARVGGILSLQHATFAAGVTMSMARSAFDAGVSLRGSTFGGESDFANVRIGQLSAFHGVKFQAKVSFNEAKVAGGVAFSKDDAESLPAASFGAGADFMGMQLDSDADFSGVHFSCPDSPVSFDGARIGGDLFLAGAECAGELIFRGIYVGGQIAAQGAVFNKQVRFNRSSVRGSILFRSEPDFALGGALFHAGADFINAQVGGNADFKGATFGGSDQLALFDGATIGGDALFEEITSAGEASFKGVHVGGKTVFDGATFGNKVSFEDAHLDGIATFKSDAGKQPVIQFPGQACFDNAHFRGSAEFTAIHFGDQASFVGAHFERNILFRHVVFNKSADFFAAVAERDAGFHQTLFSGPVSFREARFHVVHFSDGTLKSAPADQKQFRGNIDLRGFTYERIGVAWGDLLGKLDPHDRQPYRQLEAAIRGAGDDRTADDIYYALRCRENQLLLREICERRSAGSVSRKLPQLLFDILQRALFHYGVRPYRLLVLTLAVLALGVTIFSSVGAVTNRDKDLRKFDPRSLTFRQAVGVSLNQILPVEIASGSRWTPTENTFAPLGISFSACGTCLKLLGWVLVPLGVAALTGLLRRSAKA